MEGLMISRVLLMTLLLGATSAFAQDASSSSGVASSSELSSPAPASSVEPSAPAGLSDADLELAVRAAYSAASSFAVAHGNYFDRDGVFPPLRDAIAAALAEGYPAVAVRADPVADIEAGRVCLSAPGTELRIATNTFGDGITLIAVTDTRYLAYAYEPRDADEVKVIAATDCMKPN
jgi:hypothetical protein